VINQSHARDLMNRKATVHGESMDKRVRGVIIEVDGDEVVIRTNDGETMSFDIFDVWEA